MRLPIIAAALFVASSAQAEVVDSDDNGFQIAHEIEASAAPEVVWAVLRAPGKWWNKDHTYTGDSANLWMDAQAGGCFCEKLPDKGSIEHLRVIYAQPGRLLRLSGGLGPLQGEAVSGVLTFVITKAGEGAKIRLTYVVDGRIRAELGAKGLAPVVDRVLGEQVAGLKAAIESPPPAG